MKWLVILSIICAASAGPLKGGNSTISLGKNETLPVSDGKNATAAPVPLPAHSRVRRDCSLDDLSKLQARITTALEKEIERMLVGESPKNRTRRAQETSAAAGSVATPDGKVKSTAVTKGNASVDAVENEPVSPQGDKPVVPVQEGSPAAPVVPEGEPRTAQVPVVEGAPVEVQPGSALPPPSSVAEHPSGVDAPLTPAPGAPGVGSAGQPPSSIASGASAPGITVQKVKANANKATGTAVASAVAKRDVHQDIAAEGDKAISKAESHKGGDNHLQNVGSVGTQLGVATASIDGHKSVTKDGINQDTTLQNVKASGEKAVATAAKKTDGGNTVQGAVAEGDQLSIASVSTGSEEQHVDTSKIVKRSVCLPGEINDDIRLLIRTTIENAFADVKHEMLTQKS